jgi:mono/diheme cytochrome c family protein
VLVGITTGGKVGLGVVALIFIGFALTVSFLIPRRYPDFPGDRLRGFVWLTILLFAALMFAVVFFAKESEGEEHVIESEAAHETTTTGGSTETGDTGTTGTTGTGPSAGGEGDAAAGEEIFAASGCGSCHTLKAAGATGTIGPNLDEAKPDFDLVVTRVTNGMSPMPSFKDSLSEQQIKDVAAYVVQSTSG